MAYAQVTLAAAKAALAARLGNVSKTYWTDPELGRLLTESQRVFNALTGFWRERDVFNTDATKRFYDLPTVMPDQLGYTVTDFELIRDIQDALQEPVSPNVWTGSEMFTLEDVVAAVQRRMNQFLVDTGMVVKERNIPITAPPGTRSPLSAQVIDIRRLSWLDLQSVETVLNREDEFAFTTFNAGWNLRPRQIPSCYSVGVVPPLQIRIAPAPLDLGSLYALCVELGPTLTAGVETILQIPDDWCWVIRWGALADLLTQDGMAYDVQRSQYCEQRYQDGVKMAMTAPGPVMAGTIDDVELTINTCADADRFRCGWGNNTTDDPTDFALASRNLLAVVPRAPSNAFGVSLDVIRRAPVNQTYMQVPQESLDAILDYAEHIGCFKLGGDEQARSAALLERFYKYCGVDLSRYRAGTPNLDALTNAAERNDAERPRTEEPSAVAGLG